jgi:DNA modification methylase
MDIEFNRIYNMDCLEGMKYIPDNSIDLIVTDPPYMISQKNKKINRKNIDIQLDFGEWDHFENEQEYEEFTRKWMTLAYNKLKDGGWFMIFFDNKKICLMEKIAKELGMMFKTIFVWIKTNPTPHFRKMNFVSATEFIWMGAKGNMRMKNYQKQTEMYNYMLYPNKSTYGETKHPTEKPVELLKRIIRPVTLENDIVLDPFIGSGTTAIASIQLNRRFIGFEINREYYNIAMERINKAMSQQNILMDGWNIKGQ